MRKKAENDDAIPSIAPGELTSKQFRRSRARLIQKIYEVDPLCCPNCGHQMRVISIVAALDRNLWNKAAAARNLGVGRNTLNRYVRRLGISR